MVAGHRARWVPKLAKAIGWRPQRLRFFFNKRGYTHPYTSEAKGLKLLHDSGISTSKYRPTEDAIGADKVASVEPVKKKGKVVVAEETSPPPSNEAPPSTPLRGWAARLPARLARILPEGYTPAGKRRVKYILEKYKLPRPWTDEARALAAFEAEGLSIEGFEYRDVPGEPGGVSPPAKDYETLLGQYTRLGERLKQTLESHKAVEEKLISINRDLSQVRLTLLQFEAKMFAEIDAKRMPRVVPPPFDIVFNALNLVRYKGTRD
jgi:hypothetical protein